MLQSFTTPCQYDMWKNADVNRSDITPQPPLIKPHATEPYYTMSVWHVEKCRCTQVRCTAPANQIQCYYRALYYIMSVWHVEEWRHTLIRHTPPTNWTQCYRALLHHVSFTCERMQAYPGQMYTPHSLNPVLQSCTTPCQFDMWQNADVPRSDVPPP